jgi:hypothetical protein
MKPAFEVAQIIQQNLHQLPHIIHNSWKRRTLYALAKCRTAALGGHIDRCDNPKCNKLHLSYNSCRNRHCPKCQGHLQQKWMQEREKDLLNTSYFHTVFTLPDTLNQLALEEPRILYGLLFKVAWQVVKDFAANPKFMGAQSGMIAVLHTWGQNLSLHPHLHCIIPAGGLSESGKWKESKSNGKYLFPVKAMSKVFRAKMVAALRKEKVLTKQEAQQLFKKNWVIFCKKPFYGPLQVVEYLGRYTHKIAISNHRIIGVGNDEVKFSAKDYRNGGKKHVIALKQTEFIRRFAMHILPKGFTRIRHYGILSGGCKKRYKEIVDDQIGKLEILIIGSIGTCLAICPTCKKGKLQTVAVFDQRGPPLHWLKKLQLH